MRFLTLLSVLLLCSLFALPATAQDDDDGDVMRRTVTVSGEGTARAAPDLAVVRFGIQTEAEEPEAAREQNAEASGRATNAVRDLGIEESQIQLETLRLQPRYDYDDGDRRLVGYEAIRSLSVRIRDLAQVPAVVAGVVQDGANQLQGVQYTLDDRTAARNEALREAAADAQAQAALLAEALGAQVGPVMQISEQGIRRPEPRQYQMQARAMAESDDAAPESDAYAAGEIEVTATVQVVFGLE